MNKNLFITATDTDAGKTLIASSLIKGIKSETTLGYKPIAAGCELKNGKLINQDALSLLAAGDIKLDYDLVNPYALKPPIAPHIAAEQVNIQIQHNELTAGLIKIHQQAEALVVVEGAGGWMLPTSMNTFLSDWVSEHQMPVILVVGMKLGCLNHALLTAQAIQQSNAKLVGWIANCVDDNMLQQQANIDSLHKLMPVPCFGVVPHLSEGQSAAEYLDYEQIEKMLINC